MWSGRVLRNPEVGSKRRSVPSALTDGMISHKETLQRPALSHSEDGAVLLDLNRPTVDDDNVFGCST